MALIRHVAATRRQKSAYRLDNHRMHLPGELQNERITLTPTRCSFAHHVPLRDRLKPS